ncbi:flagellar biosynthetic protein FliO [Pantoea sp.]|uniref:flagellar biosynthetic protein FliO n=1 Tax=Pantoea sp. TaxID=69393 RepID=UPI0028A076EF|nr:flagellar biosynthetic protein FliO [Pantoea sp.]
MTNFLPTQAPVADAMTPGALLLNVSGALMLILFIIAALVWLARRSGLATRRLNGAEACFVVSTHSLGQRERLVTVDINDKRLLLGVTTSQITCLATFDKPEAESDKLAGSAKGSFHGELMGRLKNSLRKPTS